MEALMETGQFLTFKLGEESFALDVAKVREILEESDITKIPQTPEYMRGVINLRGSVVPVIDLRLKFGMGKTEKTVNTCIIVVEVLIEGTTTILGVLADCVQEVLEIDPSQVEATPHLGTRLDTEFICGMGKVDDHFIMMLDIDKVSFEADLQTIANN